MYAIRTETPVGYWPMAAFHEVEETLRYGLRSIGALATTSPEKTIVLGWQHLPNGHHNPREILYNFEQQGSTALQRLDLLRRHETWDYSEANVTWLRAQGVPAKHVPLGYVPELERIPVTEKTIDVLFYGATSARRERVLEELRRHRINVQVVHGVYGVPRDQLIARSRIVLNVHYYDAQIFEIVRCGYLFTNKACVVSEDSVDVPAALQGNVVFAPYTQLVDTCAALLSDKERMQAYAHRGYEAFKKSPESAYLRLALSAV